MIRAADWLIDLGPEGGDGGGAIVVAGTPADVERHPTSHTGKALREYEAQLVTPVEDPAGRRVRASDMRPATPSSCTARASTTCATSTWKIPREAFTVITGVSGSGKSTLAFDIIFNEGQRRYLESLNAYARQFVQPAARPDVDAIYGIPPTVAIEQRTSRGGRKSTVATLTEIYHFLRLLYVKLGHAVLPHLRRGHRTANRRQHRRAAAQAAQGLAHPAARAAGRGAQGLLHRARQVGQRAAATNICASTAKCSRPTSGRA